MQELWDSQPVRDAAEIRAEACNVGCQQSNSVRNTVKQRRSRAVKGLNLRGHDLFGRTPVRQAIVSLRTVAKKPGSRGRISNLIPAKRLVCW